MRRYCRRLRAVTVFTALMFCSILLASCGEEQPDSSHRRIDPLKADKFLTNGTLVTRPAERYSGLLGKFSPDDAGSTVYIPLCSQMYDVGALYREPRHVESVTARYHNDRDCFVLEDIRYSPGSVPGP
jgi:hypothetical protein